MARKAKRKAVTLPPLGGDHGPGTPAATAGTVIKPMLNEKGENPNNTGMRIREDAVDRLTSLSMRQVQAAKELRNRYFRKEQLSSGGPLKEKVDASPKPDVVITEQVSAISSWLAVWQCVPMSMRPIVEHVCCDNQPVKTFKGEYNPMGDLKVALDLVANRLGY